MVHYEFILEGKTVSGEIYFDIHHCLRDVVRMKHPENWEPVVGFPFMAMIQHTGFGLGWLSYEGCDNTGASPAHSDLVPADFYQYPWQKSSLKGWHICDATNIIKHVMEELKSLSQNGFQECFKDLHSHCRSVELNKGKILKEM
jgi:hypothetical protein